MDHQKLDDAKFFQTVRAKSTLLLALLFIGAGVAVLRFFDATDALTSSIGTTLLASGAVTIGWEVITKREQEAVQRRAIANAVVERWSDPEQGLVRSGIGVITETVIAEAFKDCEQLMATCLFDAQWSENSWGPYLRRFMDDNQHKAEFILPNPGDPELMQRLGERHGLTPDAQRGGDDARSAGQQMESKVRNLVAYLATFPSARLEVMYTGGCGPSHTAYLFIGKRGEGTGMTRLYGHAMRSGGDQPETIFLKGGRLWARVHEDFLALKEQSWHRPVPVAPA